MWMGMALLVIIAFTLIAGVLAGGIFTIVLVPIALIAALSAIVVLGMARAAGAEGATVTNQPSRMIRRTEGPELDEDRYGEVPVTPEQYLRARQRQ